MRRKFAWEFKPRFRTGVLGWRGSAAACRRLKEAVAEIKQVAKTNPETAADGVVTLLERIWPAFQNIDTSTGALPNAIFWVHGELLPILIGAPADRPTRAKWLERLWQAIQEDGVSYLHPVEERWGEICGSPEIALEWVGRLIGPMRIAWAKPDPTFDLHGEVLCLSSLLFAGRHQELLDLLLVRRVRFWNHIQFGVRALVAAGRVDDALALAESSRPRNMPDPHIDAACERILLDAGRPAEAYAKYALSANQAATGLAAFRAVARKYPGRDPASILRDLADRYGDPGRWFAAAKDAGLLDLALEFANQGRTDPRTLTRACRDFLRRDPSFALQVGRLALERILEGHGYDLTDADVIDAYNHFIAAAETLDVVDEARGGLRALATKKPRAPFSDVVLRLSSRNEVRR